MSDTRLLSPLSAAAARQIDHTCDRFEAAWKAGLRPRPEEYLGPAHDPRRSPLLRQLLLLDWEYRRRDGDDPQAGEYHARFPEEPALIEEVRLALAESPDSTHVGDVGSRGTDTPRHGGQPADLPGGAVGGPGDGVGRYELLREVGRGGIGVVFRARDRLLGRELAVKVLREDYRDDPEARRRFTEEARVGSQLQHPAIVPVYEQGWFDARRPFFTMKLIEGQTLAALLQARPDLGQDLPRWLGIFGQACQAMAYAHARGVIHRDLKPANVMVGAFGEVQVMDWGFAKVLSEASGGCQPWDPSTHQGADAPRSPAEETHSGALMGTPAYMPPEQARGEAASLDARADVFALGAILCEVLTGRPPYIGDSDEVYRKAAAGDLHDAHTRLDACGADAALRELARRCLDAERSARPQDAGAVARDLTAYLTSAAERLRQAQLERASAEARAEEAAATAKAERKARRSTRALAATLILLLLGAAAAPTVGYVLLRAEQKETEAARLAAVAAREEEARRRRQTRQALDMVTGPVIEDWLGKQPELSREQKQFLERALAIYTDFAAETSTDEASRAGLAEAHHQVGNIQRILGQMPEAEAAYDRGAELYTRLVSNSPDRPEHLKGLVRLLNNRVIVLTATGREAQAESALRDLVRLKRQLAAHSPDVVSRSYLALSLANLSILSHNSGNPGEAESLAREALALYDQLAREIPDRLGFEYGLARAWSSLGSVLAGTGRYGEAERYFRDALGRQERLAARHPNVSEARQDLANTYTGLADLLGKAGRHKEAEAANRAALKIRRQLVADFPGRRELRLPLAAAHNNVGLSLARLGRPAEAVESYRNAITMYDNLIAEAPTRLQLRLRLAHVHSGLGSVLRQLNRPEEAEAAHRAAARLYRELAEADPAEPAHRHYLAGSLHSLAGWNHLRGNSGEARRLLEEAMPHHRAAIQARPRAGEYRQYLCNNRVALALTFLAEGRHEEAADAARQAAEVAEASAGEAATALPEELVVAASYLAHCVTVANRDILLPEPQRLGLMRFYANAAMRTLRLAVRHGFQDAQGLTAQPFFAPLRSRPDFRELLAELDSQTVRKSPR